MKRFLSLFAVLVTLAALCGAFAPAASAADTSGYAAEVLRLVNAERKKAGLSALSTGPAALNNAANKRAQEIVVKFDHKRPDGRSCFTVLDEYGVESLARGENIAMGYDTPADVMAAWMNSSGHRANIMGDYTRLSVGIYVKNGTVYWTQLFIREKSTSAPSTSKAPGAPSAKAPAWKSWSPFAQWFARIFFFGWIWMK